MTNTNYQPHRLLINNIKIFEDADPILDEINEKIEIYVNNAIETWAKKNLFIAELLESDTNFYPAEWKSIENDSKPDHSYFYLDYNNNKDVHWITTLCGLGENQYGIRWHFPFYLAKNKRNKTQWKSFLNNQFNQYQSVFSQNGVELSEDKTGLFMPLKIDLNLLSENYPDSLSDAFEPLDTLLANLLNVLPEIKLIHQAASE